MIDARALLLYPVSGTDWSTFPLWSVRWSLEAVYVVRALDVSSVFCFDLGEVLSMMLRAVMIGGMAARRT